MLYSALGKEKVCLTSFIWAHFDAMTRRPTCHPTFNAISTGIFWHFHPEIRDMPRKLLATKEIDLNALKHGRILVDQHRFLPFSDRPCIRDYMNALTARERELEGGSHTIEPKEGDAPLTLLFLDLLMVFPGFKQIFKGSKKHCLLASMLKTLTAETLAQM